MDNRSFIDKWNEEGIRVHNNGYVKVGDYVEAIRDVAGEIPKGATLQVSRLLIEPPGNGRGNAVKRLEFCELEGDYNPQRFRKLTKNLF